MERHEVKIEISKNGEVKIHVKGAKGKTCLNYVEFFEQLIGPVTQEQRTHEYYEPESKVRVEGLLEQHVSEDND